MQFCGSALSASAWFGLGFKSFCQTRILFTSEKDDLFLLPISLVAGEICPFCSLILAVRLPSGQNQQTTTCLLSYQCTQSISSQKETTHYLTSVFK